jgi:hypothetical protein
MSELVEQARPTHSWLADDGHELPVACTRGFQGRAECFELHLAPHEAGEASRGSRLQAGPVGLTAVSSHTSTGRANRLTRTGPSALACTDPSANRRVSPMIRSGRARAGDQ